MIVLNLQYLDLLARYGNIILAARAILDLMIHCALYEHLAQGLIVSSLSHIVKHHGLPFNCVAASGYITCMHDFETSHVLLTCQMGPII